MAEGLQPGDATLDRVSLAKLDLHDGSNCLDHSSGEPEKVVCASHPSFPSAHLDGQTASGNKILSITVTTAHSSQIDLQTDLSVPDSCCEECFYCPECSDSSDCESCLDCENCVDCFECDGCSITMDHTSGFADMMRAGEGNSSNGHDLEGLFDYQGYYKNTPQEGELANDLQSGKSVATWGSGFLESWTPQLSTPEQEAEDVGNSASVYHAQFNEGLVGIGQRFNDICCPPLPQQLDMVVDGVENKIWPRLPVPPPAPWDIEFALNESADVSAQAVTPAQPGQQTFVYDQLTSFANASHRTSFGYHNDGMTPAQPGHQTLPYDQPASFATASHLTSFGHHNDGVTTHAGAGTKALTSSRQAKKMCGNCHGGPFDASALAKHRNSSKCQAAAGRIPDHKYACPYCDKAFHRQDHIKRHVMRVANTDGTYRDCACDTLMHNCSDANNENVWMWETGRPGGKERLHKTSDKRYCPYKIPVKYKLILKNLYGGRHGQ